MLCSLRTRLSWLFSLTKHCKRLEIEIKTLRRYAKDCYLRYAFCRRLWYWRHSSAVSIIILFSPCLLSFSRSSATINNIIVGSGFDCVVSGGGGGGVAAVDYFSCYRNAPLNNTEYHQLL